MVPSESYCAGFFTESYLRGVSNKHCLLTFFIVSFFFWGGGGLELRHFSLEMLRWFLVCIICNSKSFYSLIFELCIMIVHTLNMCLSFLCKFDKHFPIFRCLVCVICNSSSFHSFIFKLCILIVDIFYIRNA